MVRVFNVMIAWLKCCFEYRWRAASICIGSIAIVDATCDCYANRGISFSTRKIVLLQGPVLRLVTSTSMGDKFCFVDKMSLRHVYVDQSSLSFHGILCNKFTVALTIGIWQRTSSPWLSCLLTSEPLTKSSTAFVLVETSQECRSLGRAFAVLPCFSSFLLSYILRGPSSYLKPIPTCTKRKMNQVIEDWSLKVC